MMTVPKTIALCDAALREDDQSLPDNPGNDLVVIDALTYTFAGARSPALRDISLRIASGDLLVITGPSGCGKSTLALAIGGFLFQQVAGTAEGSVTVADQDVRTSPVYEIADTVGLVQQDPEGQFCTLTVRDELAFGLENRCLPRAAIRSRIAWALDVVQAPHLLDRDLRSLSGGEKQKVAIASVIAMRPKVLILDEPTSSLDPQATATIFQVINTIQQATDMAIVVIEHKLSFLEPYAPRVIQMRDGAIAEGLPVRQKPLGQGIAHLPAPTHAPPVAPRNTILRVEDLGVCVGERVILDGVSLAARPGEFIILMGDNGSGKTTLLRALLGLQHPTSGSVTVLDADARRTPVSRLAQQVGFVFQNPNHQLFADTVWEEATMALSHRDALDEQAADYVRGLLDRAGLADRVDDHPYRLSYGEKRRLNLISVLCTAPRLLLLDEILIGQDPGNVDLLLDLLDTASADGATVVMVNHNPEITTRYATQRTTSGAPRLLFLADGRIVIDEPVQQGLVALRDRGLTAYLPVAQR